jgi:hypothetical protein
MSRTFWESWFLPNARYLGLAIAAGELVIALLILGRGRWTRAGLVCATLFHLALAALFGMWPYTVPMVLVLGHMTTLEFPAGPVARVIGRLRRARSTHASPLRFVERDAA